ncbi:MAG TPA: zinc dependent phospholipase C family protein [Gemmatimonadota bacterium]|nr:zinc dependent phospholipase C family protein [Gemmatimonadota bacterium]
MLAWGPTTHAYIGSQVLGNLGVLPLIVRELLAAHPHPFLYGSLSADITLAKRYVHYSRNCHNWNVAYEILDRAETPALQSFALGYLSHLAADTIAHNVFVPRRLLSTPHSSNLGHTYWEYRFDADLGEEYLRLAREVVTMDHEEPDALLEGALTQAFFSFQTNKRIFQRLIHLSNRERWRNLWVRMADQSRWELPREEVESYNRLSTGYVLDFLRRGAESLSQELDPTGHERLALAKKLRRQAFRAARRQAGRELAVAPISSLSREDATRLIGTRPVPQAEMELLAAVFFPEPAIVPEPGEPSLVVGDEMRDEHAFWNRFTAGRALPAGHALPAGRAQPAGG